MRNHGFLTGLLIVLLILAVMVLPGFLHCQTKTLPVDVTCDSITEYQAAKYLKWLSEKEYRDSVMNRHFREQVELYAMIRIVDLWEQYQEECKRDTAEIGKLVPVHWYGPSPIYVHIHKKPTLEGFMDYVRRWTK